jgi:hypothetical protein
MTMHEEPTIDLRVAITRLAALLEVERHQPVGPKRGRWLARKAVYGNLWTPERIGEIPEGQRAELRTLASRIIGQLFPRGSRTKLTADQVWSTWKRDLFKGERLGLGNHPTPKDRT